MKDIIIIGDGLGVRTLPAKAMELDVLGTDISEYAIEHSICKNLMIQDDIVDTKIKEQAKLVVAYDVLEHIDYKDIDKVINTLIKVSKKYILISVPVLGDPNLENDSTHKIKETREWWIEQFTKKELKYIETPDNFLFKEQILIFEK